MRFKTFRTLVIAGGATAIVGSMVGCWALFSHLADRPAVQQPSAPAPVSPAPRPVTSAPAAPAYDPSLRPVDRMILEFLRQPATSDKVKDAFRRESFKVNVYRDQPGKNWTRLKVDLDRDEIDDEKWDLVDGQPAKRHVSTKDDGTYDLEYRWEHGAWVAKAPK